MTEPTPYDTGQVLQPMLWLDNDPVNNGSPNWGKVDFDDDEGASRATVFAERREDGRYMMIIDDLFTGKTHAILLGEALD